MRFLTIKAIFLLLIYVGTIAYSVDANSTKLQSFEIVNLSNIKYDYLHNMTRYAESKIANINELLSISYSITNGVISSYQQRHPTIGSKMFSFNVS